MAQSLEQRDYPAALAQAQKLLASDAQNVEALRVRDAAENALAQLDIAVGEARAALERGANAEAAEALGRVLALDPNHPLGVELNDELNQHFQGQAESAQADMTQARSAASSAGARSRPEFRQAESLRQQASDDFNGSEYTNAAQKFLAARDGYQQARSAHQQAEGARRAEAQQSQQAAQTQAEAQASARAELEGAQNAWTRARRQPDEAGVTEQPSYQRAMSEEANAKRLAGSGDLSGAARGYQTAASYLEAADANIEKPSNGKRRKRRVVLRHPPPPPRRRPRRLRPRARRRASLKRKSRSGKCSPPMSVPSKARTSISFAKSSPTCRRTKRSDYKLPSTRWIPMMSSSIFRASPSKATARR